jgi:hypothetical protein
MLIAAVSAVDIEWAMSPEVSNGSKLIERSAKAFMIHNFFPCRRCSCLLLKIIQKPLQPLVLLSTSEKINGWDALNVY